MNLDYLRRMGYDQAKVMLLVFDVHNPDTLLDIQKRWIGECYRYAETAKILLVGVQSGLKTFTDFLYKCCICDNIMFKKITLSNKQ